MKKVIVPAYKYDEESKTLVDRYVCFKCSKLVKEEKRVVECRSKSKRNSVIYYVICSKCNNKSKE